MICNSCAAAAKVLHGIPVNARARPSALILAGKLHGQCKGCTCQHRIPAETRADAAPVG